MLFEIMRDDIGFDSVKRIRLFCISLQSLAQERSKCIFEYCPAAGDPIMLDVARETHGMSKHCNEFGIERFMRVADKIDRAFAGAEMRRNFSSHERRRAKIGDIQREPVVD